MWKKILFRTVAAGSLLFCGLMVGMAIENYRWVKSHQIKCDAAYMRMSPDNVMEIVCRPVATKELPNHETGTPTE